MHHIQSRVHTSTSLQSCFLYHDHNMNYTRKFHDYWLNTKNDHILYAIILLNNAPFMKFFLLHLGQLGLLKLKMVIWYNIHELDCSIIYDPICMYNQQKPLTLISLFLMKYVIDAEAMKLACIHPYVQLFIPFHVFVFGQAYGGTAELFLLSCYATI